MNYLTGAAPIPPAREPPVRYGNRWAFSLSSMASWFQNKHQTHALVNAFYWTLARTNLCIIIIIITDHMNLWKHINYWKHCIVLLIAGRKERNSNLPLNPLISIDPLTKHILSNHHHHHLLFWKFHFHPCLPQVHNYQSVTLYGS